MMNRTNRLHGWLAPLGLAFMLLGLSSVETQAGMSGRLDTAWQEAVRLSGADESRLERPEVRFDVSTAGVPTHRLAEFVPFANEVLIYRVERVPLHSLLVHEFLHSIYFQMHAADLNLAQLSQMDPSEAWVQSRADGRHSH